eukprot:1369886-Rhodomonas_salina.1
MRRFLTLLLLLTFVAMAHGECNVTKLAECADMLEAEVAWGPDDPPSAIEQCEYVKKIWDDTAECYGLEGCCTEFDKLAKEGAAEAVEQCTGFEMPKCNNSDSGGSDSSAAGSLRMGGYMAVAGVFLAYGYAGYGSS